MKKSTLTVMITLLTLILSTSFALAGNGRLGNSSGPRGLPDGSGLSLLPVEDLSETEIDALTQMVEEEKVARDVYTALFEEWGLPVFANIADSEQQHMDAIAALLDKYGLDNTAATLATGEFNDPELQTLYDNLVAAGQNSVEDALLVGATIEDLDIADLWELLGLVDNQDITQAFTSLAAGSENHLRAFSAILTIYGYAPYEAQFLDQDEIDEILASASGRGGNGGQNSRNLDREPGNLTREPRMIDADGDGICDFLQ